MAGRYDVNPFDEEDEVNPFSVSSRAATVQQFGEDVFSKFFICQKYVDTERIRTLWREIISCLNLI